MIVICEPICCGMEHIPFNASFLETVRLAYPSEPILFFGENRHLELCKKAIGSHYIDTIKWVPITIPARHSDFSERIGSDIALIKHLTRKIKSHTHDAIVFSNTNASILGALKINRILLRNETKIQLIFHGALGSYNGWRSRNPVKRIQHLKSIYDFGSNRNFQFVFLEEGIRNCFLNIAPKGDKKQFVVLEHPVPPDEGSTKAPSFKPPFRFGFLGLCTKAKGFHTFLNTAADIKARYGNQSDFKVVGRIEGDINSSGMPFLSRKPVNHRLEREAYIEGLQSLHFVCIPYQGRHYDLCPSGVLLDAVAWQKPIIGTDIHLLRSIFAKHENIGYLCSGSDRFSEVIEKIILSADQQNYLNQVKNLGLLKKQRHPDNLHIQYRSLLDKIRY